MKHILLAGPSGAGKTTLARALCSHNYRTHIPTSRFLRQEFPNLANEGLFAKGREMDERDPNWLANLTGSILSVVDAVRSDSQDHSFTDQAIRVNVTCSASDLRFRRGGEFTTSWMFKAPDVVWNSSQQSLSTIVAAIDQLAGLGSVDLLVGGQFGSEGKGKLAALISGPYQMLVRSGGPNAGHWVRDEYKGYEFCYHHLPSGTMANPRASILIGAGATINPDKFLIEVEATKSQDRIHIDPNVVLIEPYDRDAEGLAVDLVGSTAQGVGSATSRRILRGMSGKPVVTVAEDPRFKKMIARESGWRLVSRCLASSGDVLIEGTQGSALSLWHGEYPFTTSRDTNAAGLLAEVGVPPSAVRDTWMVVRSFPIRVGGNSGPLTEETTWEDVARGVNMDPLLLKSREMTSTTNRQRRVGQFDRAQFHQAVALNRPTRLFLSFADYIDEDAAGVTLWSKLPKEVRLFVDTLEELSGIPVAGVSTGRMQADVAWSGDYLR